MPVPTTKGLNMQNSSSQKPKSGGTPKNKSKKKKGKEKKKKKKRSQSCIDTEITPPREGSQSTTRVDVLRLGAGSRLGQISKDVVDNVDSLTIADDVIGSVISRAGADSRLSRLPPMKQPPPTVGSTGQESDTESCQTATCLTPQPPLKGPNNNTNKEGKKRIRPGILVAVKPNNQMAEKDKFYNSGFNYNPQFSYKYETKQKVLDRFSTPSDALLPLALKIMKNGFERHGTYEQFEEKTGGRRLSGGQIVEAARHYLKKEGMLQEVSVQLSKDLVSRACFSRIKGQPTLQVRLNSVRENWMEGLLRHEIGTHYLRSHNNKQQVWKSSKKRRQMSLRPLNPTEEGLAALHTVLFRQHPCLWRPALLYYTTFMASTMSFSQLFKDLSKFVADPDTRWDYCLRAKRGQQDTAEPGGFCKDQVYLKGALEILKNRDDIDFHLLLKLGKVCYQDVERLRDMANLADARVPAFMNDLDLYRSRLEYIMEYNNLTDEDLSVV